MRAGKRRNQGEGGFTYVGVLFLLVLLGLGLAGTGEAWSLASRRAREKELLWVGNQYARAIRAYYMQSPGTRQFPSQLEDLLEDRRFPQPRRHLRQLYNDPMTRDRFDVVLSDNGRIGGVRSHSDDTPMKQDNFPSKFRDFKGSTHYSDWLFIADNLPGAPVRPQAAGAAPGAPAATDTTATPGSPATATPTTADPGTPGSASTAPPAAAAPAAPVRPGPVIQIKR
jgi:type II secretory pathway pseudopilin PulG